MAVLQRALLAGDAWPCAQRPAGHGRCAAATDLQRRRRYAQARELIGGALERLRPRLPRVAALLEDAEDDLLAFYAFPGDHWTKLRSTNPLERVNREIGRRTDVVGIFPNDRSLIRLAASVVIEQNDEWLVGRRYLSNHSLETILDQEQNDGNNREQTRPAQHRLSSQESNRRATPPPGT